MLLLCYTTGMAGGSLRVTPRSGTPVTFLFDDQPQITFLAGNLKIVTSGQNEPVTFELDDIDSIDFPSASGLSEPADTGGIRFTTDAAGVHFFNLAPQSNVEVYTLCGAIADSRTADGEFHLLRADHKRGVYIVKINQFVTKISL